MTECKELAGKIIGTLTLYGEGNYGPEVNITFTDGTTLNVCLKTEFFTEAKHTANDGGEPRLLHNYSCPLGAL